MNKPILCDVPTGSRIAQALPHNDFFLAQVAYA